MKSTPSATSDEVDPLAPARGCLIWVFIGAAMWVVIAWCALIAWRMI